MVSTAILVVQIVGMFPHIKGEQGLQSLRHWILGILFLCDDKLAILICREPHPPGAKERHSFLRELFLKGFKRTVLPRNRLTYLSRRPIILTRLPQPLEIQVVVQYLPRIIEDGTNSRALLAYP